MRRFKFLLGDLCEGVGGDWRGVTIQGVMKVEGSGGGGRVQWSGEGVKGVVRG
jgi:hypothetical protein